MRIWMASILLVTALAGCLEGDSAAETEPAPADSTPDAANVAAPAPCKQVDNYAVLIGTGTHYYFTGPGGATDSRVYEEDNGLSGLQTEESCPENHDSRVS